MRWPLPKKLSRGLRVPTPRARFLPLRIYIVLSSLSPLRSVKPTAGDAELPGYVLPSFRGGRSHGSRIKLLKPKLETLVERSSRALEKALTGLFLS